MTRSASVIVTLVAFLLPICTHSTCISDLNELTSREIEVAQQSKEERSKPVTYVLCSNTVFQIGFPSAGSQTTYEDGSLPIVLLNPYRTVQCGDDGSLANNCTIVGGDHQLLVPGIDDLPPELASLSPQDSLNLTVRGLTFEACTELTISMTNVGSLVIDECIIRGQPSGDFVAYFKPAVGVVENRQLQEEGNFQLTMDRFIKVSVTNSTWDRNVANLAVVASIGNVLLDIEGNQFKRNDIDVLAGVGSLVWLTDGQGSLRNSCLQNNSYPLAAVLVNGGVFEIKNNAGQDLKRSQELGCNDAWLFVQPATSLGQALKEKDYICTPFEGLGCFGATSAAHEHMILFGCLVSAVSFLVLYHF